MGTCLAARRQRSWKVKVEGARMLQRRSECARGTGRNGAAALSEKQVGPAKRSKTKAKRRRQQRSVRLRAPRGSSMTGGSQMTVLN